jgi:hypothetical protein
VKRHQRLGRPCPSKGGTSDTAKRMPAARAGLKPHGAQTRYGVRCAVNIATAVAEQGHRVRRIRDAVEQAVNGHGARSPVDERIAALLGNAERLYRAPFDEAADPVMWPYEHVRRLSGPDRRKDVQDGDIKVAPGIWIVLLCDRNSRLVNRRLECIADGIPEVTTDRRRAAAMSFSTPAHLPECTGMRKSWPSTRLAEGLGPVAGPVRAEPRSSVGCHFTRAARASSIADP